MAVTRYRRVRGIFATAFQRNYFQTLVHIGVTTLWVMPVIAGAPWARVAFAILACTLHLILSELGYYSWAMNRPVIDGGPLGFLTWTVPFRPGRLVAVARDSRGRGVARDEVDTAGAPYALRLTPDRTVLRDDGNVIPNYDD